MKQIKLFFLLLASSMIFTGCFEMLEEVTYNSKKGNGTYKFVMDMGGMKSMIEMAAAMDTTGEFSMDTLDQFSDEFVSKVTGLSGITNIEAINNKDDLQFGVEFSYNNVSALNVAVQQLFEDGELSSGGNQVFFKGKKKLFERLDSKGFNSMMDQMMGAMGDEGDGGEMEMAKMFFKDVSYTMIYHFDRKVKKVSNSQATISGDNKTVELKYFIFDEERGGSNASIENKIKLKGGWFW